MQDWNPKEKNARDPEFTADENLPRNLGIYALLKLPSYRGFSYASEMTKVSFATESQFDKQFQTIWEPR
jgi:hypothetical protein